MIKKDRRNSDLFRTIFFSVIGISIIGSLLGSFGGIGLFLFLAFLVYRFAKSKSDEQQTNRTQTRQHQSYSSGSSTRGKEAYSGKAFSPWQEEVNKSWKQYQEQFGGSSSSSQNSGQSAQSTSSSQENSYRQSATKKVVSTKLPRSTRKRKKVIASFNKKHNLTLTDQEMQRIVDASYISESWKQELESMTEQYDNINQWFLSDHGWLRIYIYVFELQNISSDFDRQKSIVLETFQEIFSYAESLQHMNLIEKIQRVNDRFFTYFDEPSFMMAYRFLEKEGYHYNLDEEVEVVHTDSSLDELKKKYDSMPAAEASEMHGDLEDDEIEEDAAFLSQPF